MEPIQIAMTMRAGQCQKGACKGLTRLLISLFVCFERHALLPIKPVSTYSAHSMATAQPMETSTAESTHGPGEGTRNLVLHFATA